MRNGPRILEMKGNHRPMEQGDGICMGTASDEREGDGYCHCGEFLVAEFLHFCLVSARNAGIGPLSSAG